MVSLPSNESLISVFIIFLIVFFFEKEVHPCISLSIDALINQFRSQLVFSSIILYDIYKLVILN